MILLLSIVSSLSWFTACGKTPAPIVYVPVGEEKVVGSITAGILAWAADADPAGEYMVVTKAFVLKAIWGWSKVAELELELKKYRKGPEK